VEGVVGERGDEGHDCLCYCAGVSTHAYRTTVTAVISP
jgi:hypothetical protein